MRFEALTGFRFLAVCLVFVYHSRKHWREFLHPEVLRLFNEFHIGVTLFFVLSGFLIAYTYAETPLQSAKSYFKYMGLRLARILPLYWLILTIFYLDPGYGNLRFTWITYSLVHGFSSNYNLLVVSQAWSLNVEMMFYFLAPLLFLLRKKHLIFLLTFLGGLLALTWGIGAVWHALNGNAENWLYPFRFILESTFPGRCLEFIAGLMLAHAIRNHKAAWIESFPRKTLIGFSGIFIIAYVAGFFQPDRFHHSYDHPAGQAIMHLVLPLFVVTALAGLIYERTWLQRFFASRPVVLLGNASFAFYLIHISYVNLKIKQLVFFPDRNFVLLWVISIILYLCFEKPIYNVFRKWLK